MDVGKDWLKSLCEAFGGIVTSEISKQTKLLIIGNDPGLKKVSQAYANGVQQIDIYGLQAFLFGQLKLEFLPIPLVHTFSKGINRNGLSVFSDTEHKDRKSVQVSKSVKKLSKQKTIKQSKTPKKLSIRTNSKTCLLNEELKENGFYFLNALNISENESSANRMALEKDGFYFLWIEYI